MKITSWNMKPCTYLIPFLTLLNIRRVLLGLGTFGIFGDFLKLRLVLDLEVGEFLWRVQCPRARSVSPRTGAPEGVCWTSWWAFMARLPPNEWLLRTGVDLLLYLTCSNWTWLSNWKGSFLVTGTVIEKRKSYSSEDLVTSSSGNLNLLSIHANQSNETLPQCAKHQTFINFPFRALFPLPISYINIPILLWGNQMIKSKENFNFIPPIS